MCYLKTYCGTVVKLTVTLSLMWMLVKYSEGTWKSEKASTSKLAALKRATTTHVISSCDDSCPFNSIKIMKQRKNLQCFYQNCHHKRSWPRLVTTHKTLSEYKSVLVTLLPAPDCLPIKCFLFSCTNKQTEG